MEDYVHRVGRTGRAGNKGTAITFITPDECAAASDLIKALETAQNIVEIPQALLDLNQLYHDRVSEGDIEKRRSNVGYIGKGHKFTREEEDNVKKERMALSKGYGFGLDENDEGDQAEELASELQRRKDEEARQEQYLLIQTIEKDPEAKKIAMEAAHRASKDALKEGLSVDEANQVAKTAMIEALQEYKPKVVGQDAALQNVIKIRNQFVEEKNESRGIFTDEIDINDYPQFVRAKVQSRDFLT